MELAIRLLGTLEADVAGQAADLGGPRQRAVLGLLLVARGAAVSVDRLTEDLWGGQAPPRATGALQVYVSNLRRALEPARAPRAPARRLVSAPPGYAIRVEESAVDAWRFETLVRTAADATAAAAQVTALEAALGMWRGGALAEFVEEPWAAPEAARLDELRLVARERLADARVRLGRAAEAGIDAETLVRDAPLREEGWRLLALSQYLGGRQGDALATLRRARQVLADELGVDPGRRLVQLERDVLAQTVVLDQPAGPHPDQPGEPRPNPPSEAQPPPRPGQSAPPPPPSGSDAGARSALPAFVGRTNERQTLVAAAGATRAGTPAVALVAGEAGGGKSALLARLRDELEAAGWRVTVGRCPEDEGGPPARAWAEVLRTLARENDPAGYTEPLAMLLGDTGSAPTEDPDGALMGRFRLHRAVHDWLATLDDRPLAVVLDDMHRADAETRTLLAGLLDQGLPNRVLFLIAYRPESTEPLDDLLATLARHAPTRVRLTGLGEGEAAELIEAVTGSVPAPGVVQALATRTDGNPFYLTESARLLVSEGDVVATSQVPEGVGDVLRRRLARLPAEAVSVLRLAAVIGRDVDVALLIHAAEVSEEFVLDALEAGVISGLLLEPGPGAVRFSHLLVRETLYTGVPNVRRVRWHARVADAVAELYPADLTAIAHHAARSATAASATEAAARCVAAAELAESRFAFDTEAELYLEAERCLEIAPAPDPVALVQVMTRRVPALVRSGGTSAATGVRRRAVELAAEVGDPQLLAAAITSALVPALRSTLRRYGETDHELVAVIERLLHNGNLDQPTRGRLLCTLIRETSSVDDPRCEAAFLEARAIATEVGSVELMRMALWSANEVYCADIEPEPTDGILAATRRLNAGQRVPAYEVGEHVMAVNRAARLSEPELARHHVDQIRTISRTFQLRQGVFQADVLDAMLAHLSGDLDGADAAYDAAYETQLRRGTVDAGSAHLLALVTLRHTQGRLAELVEPLRRAHASVPAMAHLLGLALAQSGDLAGARDVLTEAPDRFRDYLWLVFSAMRALTVATTGAVELAGPLYAELLPYTDQVAGASTNGFAFVPVAQALGRLAALLGRSDAAEAHFDQAQAVAQRWGSAPMLALIERDRTSLAQPSRTF